MIGNKITEKTPMDRFADLREKVLPLLHPYVKKVYVFGSFARGELTPDSDIDILVELKPRDQRPCLGFRSCTHITE
jgi:predicted nucleotidyltransferase